MTKRGTVIESLFSKILNSKGEMTSSHKITVDGVDWTVNIIIEFISKENDNEVEQALKKDSTANKLIFSNELKNTTDAQWSNYKRAIQIGNHPEEQVFKHELGHLLGLPHAVFIPGSSLFGNMETAEGNGAYKTVNDAGIMSYSVGLKLRKREIKFMVLNAINLSKTVENQIVNVHLSGWVYKNVPIEQIEKQTPFTDPVKFKKRMDQIKRIKNNPKSKYNDKIID